MNTNQQKHDDHANRDPDKHDSELEKLAKQVDPPGRETSDDDLRDPGNMTPDATPTRNRS